MEIVLGSYPQPVRSLSAELVGKNIKALVVACNTATAAAIDRLRTVYPNLPIIGVEPAVKPAVALSKTGRIGVMATRSTLACDGLAGAIERGASLADATKIIAVCARHTGAIGLFGT